MEILDKLFNRYETMTYERLSSNRFMLKDSQIEKEATFNLRGVDLTEGFIPTKTFHNKIASVNDFAYIDGHGFYLDGYAEFKITGFWDDEGYKGEFEGFNKEHQIGHTRFELSEPSDLFDFLTRFEDETKVDYSSIKLTGVTEENVLVELEKALFCLAHTYSEYIIEEYKEFLYPRIVDMREVGMLMEEFDYTEIDLDLDWSSPYFRSLSQFNQGESSDTYDTFAFYRFIESFFGEEKEEDEIIGLVESIDHQELVTYASNHHLIDSNNATAKSLAKQLYQVRNNYVHHKLKGKRLFEPSFNVPVAVLSKWKVVTREIAIQLLNKHCK